MYLFRALNNLDILGDPTKNGIASKQTIFKIVQNYYDNSNNKKYHSLNGLEKELFITEHIEEYLKTHGDKLGDKYYRYSKKSRDDMKDFCELNKMVKSKSKEEVAEILKDVEKRKQYKFGSYVSLNNYLSGLQTHLMFGSNRDTDWISFSTDLTATLRYYDNQDIHKLAVVRTNSGGLLDTDNILTVDLSTFDKIKEKGYLCNKIDMDEDIIDIIADLATINPSYVDGFLKKMIIPTDINSRGFKYANKSREVCIFKYVPQDHVVSVLEALQIDLIKARLFNPYYFNLPLEDQKICLEQLKRTLEFHLLSGRNNFASHVFNELYIKNKNIKSLVNFNDSEEKIIHTRNKILGLAKSINNYQIRG